MGKYPYLGRTADGDGNTVIGLFSIPGTCCIVHSESDEERYKFGNILYGQKEKEYTIVDKSVVVKISNEDLIEEEN